MSEVVEFARIADLACTCLYDVQCEDDFDMCSVMTGSWLQEKTLRGNILVIIAIRKEAWIKKHVPDVFEPSANSLIPRVIHR